MQTPSMSVLGRWYRSPPTGHLETPGGYSLTVLESSPAFILSPKAPREWVLPASSSCWWFLGCGHIPQPLPRVHMTPLLCVPSCSIRTLVLVLRPPKPKTIYLRPLTINNYVLQRTYLQIRSCLRLQAPVWGLSLSPAPPSLALFESGFQGAPALTALGG